MANLLRFFILLLLISINNIALSAMAARGFHNNFHGTPRNNNALDNWSYKHYYNPGYVVGVDDDDDDDSDDDNDDASSDSNNTNSVVVNPVVVNPVIVDKDDSNPINTETKAVKIYQYTDEQGVTHFSDLPFKNGR